METERIKLVEEENTIYEIDLNCLEKKEARRRQEEVRRTRRDKEEGRNQDFS